MSGSRAQDERATRRARQPALDPAKSVIRWGNVASSVSARRTAYPVAVLQDVRAEAEEAEELLQAALRRLEEETVEDVNRADWENVPALEAGDGHETPSDAQLRVALNDARDAIAEVEDLVSILIDGPSEAEG